MDLDELSIADLAERGSDCGEDKMLKTANVIEMTVIKRKDKKL